jgi:thioredoxin 1
MNQVAEPTRQEIDSLAGTTLLEFGASWCPHCRRAQPHIAAAVAAHPGLRHVRIEDGSGQPLGRSFGVRLWPTLILMHDGVEKARVVRPPGVREIEALFAG